MSDAALHAALVKAVRDRRVDVFIDARMYNRLGSPSFSAIDNVGPLTLLLIIGMIVLFSQGVLIGLIALTLALVAQWVLLRPWIEHRLHARTIELMLHSPQDLQILWRTGGVAMVVKGGSTGPCIAPDGDWRAFVRRYLPVDEGHGGRIG